VGIFGPLKSAWRAVLKEYKDLNPSQAGIPKTDFPRLLEKTLKRADPGKHLPAAFEKCGLYPVNVDRAMERIPHKDMDCSDSIKELLNSSLGDKLDQLRGTAIKNKVKKRGKKITGKVPAGKSYSDMHVETEEEADSMDEMDSEDKEDSDSDIEIPDQDEEEVVKGKSKGKGKYKLMPKKTVRAIQTSDSDSDIDLPEPDVPVQTHAGAGGSWWMRPANFAVGAFVVAVYDKQWYLAQVEGEEPDEESEGLTLLKYMERRGNNQFIWGQTCDRLKTLDSDILLRVEPPIPVSSRLWGLPKDVLKEVEKLFRVLWSIIFIFIIFSNMGFVFNSFCFKQNV
jgi:hypothetical protein